MTKVDPKITFITRHYPPNPNINGESVCDMVKYLKDKFGIDSNVICINRSSPGGGQRREPQGNVIKINTLYQGRNVAIRFITFLYDGFMLVRKALKYKDTLIVCTTSPPMLPFWASLLFKKKVKWALWAFDLFPEGFSATNFISEKSFIYRKVIKITYRNAPSFLIALGPKQAEYLQNKYHKEIPSLTLPCGVFFYQNKSKIIPHWKEEDKIYLGYCGNLGDAHNADFLISIIDNIDPERHRLVLALYGVKASMVKDYARNKPGVILIDSVPRDQLHFIDVHLVTLAKKWTHIAVPSKAVSAVSLGSTILFCGDEKSDNWYILKRAGWFIEENSVIAEQTRNFLDSLTKDSINLKREQASLLNIELQNYITLSYDRIAGYSNNPIA